MPPQTTSATPAAFSAARSEKEKRLGQEDSKWNEKEKENDEEDDEEEEEEEDRLHPPHDPSVRCCAWCYNPQYTVDCPNCPRVYCSPTCQDIDWNSGGHDYWCGKAGEKGIDFDVMPVRGKGLGVVTQRTFHRGEAILVERPVLTTRNVMRDKDDSSSSKTANANIRRAAMALTPNDGDLQDKVDANGVSLSNAYENSSNSNSSHNQGVHAAGLFVTFSRVNHDCLGNSEHYFDKDHGVEVLVANDTIPPGQEITFPYVRHKNRNSELQWRGFQCTCSACWKGPQSSLHQKVDQMVDLEEIVVTLGGSPVQEEAQYAIQSAHKLLDLYNDKELGGISDMKYAKTHYDLFQMHILRDETLPLAQPFIEQAYRHAKRFTNYEGHDIVQLYKTLAQEPQRHENYRAHAAADASSCDK